MNPEEIAGAFRIADDYCRLVNPDKLTAVDIDRLDRGRTWLASMLAELPQAMNGAPLNTAVTDQPPSVSDQPSEFAAEALTAFKTINEEAKTLTQQLMAAPKDIIPSYNGGLRYDAIARHLARVSNLASVDRNWIWGP
jgi:hypothetical protein